MRSKLIETMTCKLFGEWQNPPAPRDILANGRLWKVMPNAAPSLTWLSWNATDWSRRMPREQEHHGLTMQLALGCFWLSLVGLVDDSKYWGD